MKIVRWRQLQKYVSEVNFILLQSWIKSAKVIARFREDTQIFWGFYASATVVPLLHEEATGIVPTAFANVSMY